jgi:prolipoprotein diacylglyceryltransferase
LCLENKYIAKWMTESKCVCVCVCVRCSHHDRLKQKRGFVSWSFLLYFSVGFFSPETVRLLDFSPCYLSSCFGHLLRLWTLSGQEFPLP